MIPKIIHYCWFGKNPKPKLAEKCIGSWKKFCSDYDIIEWNEDNFDISSSPLYVRQAYEAKRWAFVTDYVRLWALTEFGGVYMDTDVEVVKSLDPFLDNKAFSGFEDETHIPTGIMACEREFPLFKEFLAFYDEASFILPDGSYNTQTNVVTISQICRKKGLVLNNNKQIIEGFVLYPKDFFCPVNFVTRKLEKTRRTVTIHWFAGSWLTKEDKERLKARKKRIQRQKVKDSFDYIAHTPNRTLRLLLGEDKYNNLKNRLKGS